MNIISFAGWGPVNYFFWLLLLAAFVVEAWAFIDAVRQQKAAFPAAGKQTKPLWLIILGVALVIGLGGAIGRLNVFSFLPIAAFVAAAIYLADVRPKVGQFKRGSSSSSSRQGPYGPW
ncbi:MAG TPA: DUF2516 family protein [Streptosporangiaceae bacterium]|nr:DUF2516 family protein [Streptosporangiaceae bacterium]